MDLGLFLLCVGCLVSVNSKFRLVPSNLCASGPRWLNIYCTLYFLKTQITQEPVTRAPALLAWAANLRSWNAMLAEIKHNLSFGIVQPWPVVPRL